MPRDGSDSSVKSDPPTHLAVTPAPAPAGPATAATVRLGGAADIPPTLDLPGPLVLSITGSHHRNQKPPEVPGFDVQGELGRGGMGVVYRAVQQKLNRQVALKMLRHDDPTDPSDVVRFRSEAEAVAAVRHPHVVQVYAYGLHDGRPYFAMEYLPGGTLHARLRADAPFPPERAAGLIEKLARAVHAAHSQGIIHRDIKPGNVLFDAAGEPRVTDFGLAKRVACDLTQTNAVMGTPAYMPPEQAAGRAKFAGPPADIYALGVILYECLTGDTPFHDDDSLALMHRVIHDAPPPLRSKVGTLPRDLELICLKCLEKEPHDRYHTAAALADDLQHFLNREPVSVRPAGPVERAVKWARRRPTAATAYGLAALAVFLALFGGGLAVLWRRAADARDAADGHAQQVEAASGELERKNGELERTRDELERKNGQVEQARADEARHRAQAEAARDLLGEQKGTVEQALAGETAAKKAAETARAELAVASYFHNVGFALREAQDGNFIRAQQMLDECPKESRGWEWWHAYRHAHQEIGSGRCDLMAVDVAFAAPRKVVTARVDGAVTVFDFAKRTGVKVPLAGKGEAGYEVRLSADGGRLLAVAPAREKKPTADQIAVWDTATGKRVAVWDGPGRGVFDSALSGDGRRAFVHFPDGLRCLDVESGKEVGRIAVSHNNPRTTAPSHDGAEVAVVNDLRVSLWDGTANEFTEHLPSPHGRPTATALSPDRRTVVIGTNSGAIAIHDRKTGTPIKHLKAHAGWVNVAAFSPDGRYAATAGEDGAVRVWEAATGEPAKTFLGHHQKVLGLRFDATGEKLVSSDAAFLFYLWGMKEDYRPRFSVVVPKADGGVFAADRDVKRVFAAGSLQSRTGTVHLHDGVGTFPVPLPPGQPLTAFGLAPTGTAFAAGGGHGRVEWWEGPDAKPVLVGQLVSYTHTVRFSADGKLLLVASGRRWLLWDTAAKKELDVRASINDAVALSPDGGTVAAAEGYHVTLTPVGGVPRHLFCPGVVTAVAFHPDGKRVLAATERQGLCEYALDSKDHPPKPLRSYLGHTTRVTCLTYNADGTRMASGSADGCVKVWDAKTGREAIGLNVGGRDAVQEVWFTGDGQKLVAIPRDRPPVIFDGSPRNPAFKPHR